MIERLNSLDTLIFLKINSLHSPFLDQVMWHISGKIEWIPIYLILLIILFKKFEYRSIFILISIALLIALTDIISAQVIKELVRRPRPSHVNELSNLIHLVNEYHGGRYGFVSNHAANFFGLATFLSLIFRNKTATFALCCWALLISYSRIYLGVHYPGDILGGAILGVLAAFAVFAFYIWFNGFILQKTMPKRHGH